LITIFKELALQDMSDISIAKIVATSAVERYLYILKTELAELIS